MARQRSRKERRELAKRLRRVSARIASVNASIRKFRSVNPLDKRESEVVRTGGENA